MFVTSVEKFVKAFKSPQTEPLALKPTARQSHEAPAEDVAVSNHDDGSDAGEFERESLGNSGKILEKHIHKI